MMKRYKTARLCESDLQTIQQGRMALMNLIEVMERLRTRLEETQDQLGKAREAADRDPALPVLNGSAFRREIGRQLDTLRRHGTSACLIYLDLDGFKAVNDGLGHLAGDAVLEQFAAALLVRTRSSDTVGRLGGDEFAILLPHMPGDAAAPKAEALVAGIAAEGFRWKGRSVPLTFAWGTTDLRPSDTAESAIARADEAMYVHKKLDRQADASRPVRVRKTG